MAIFKIGESDRLALLSSKSPVLVLQNLVNALFGIVALFFVTRFYPIAWGVLAFAIGFVGLFTLINDLGYSTAGVRTISHEQNPEEANGTLLMVKLALGGVFVVVSVVSLFVWVYVLHRGFEYQAEFWASLELIPYYLFTSLIGFAQANFTAKISPARIGVPSMVESILRNSIIIILVVLSVRSVVPISTSDMMLILPGIYSFTFAVYLGVSQYMGRPWKIGRPTRKMLSVLTALALPLALSSSVSVINGNIDKVLIEFFYHADATGAFYLNQRLVTVVSNFAFAISVFFIPLLTVAAKTGDLKKLGDTIRDHERFITLFIAPIVVVSILLGRFILNLFGGYYSGYALLLPLLSLSAFFNISAQPYYSAVVARGRTTVVAYVTIFTMAVNIALNLLLIPQSVLGYSGFSLGVTGAGVSTMVASLIMNLSYRIYLKREIGLNLRTRTAYMVFPALVQGVFLGLLLMFVQPNPIVELLPVALISILIFFGVALAMKFTTFRELSDFLRNVSPLRLGYHIRNEKN